MILVSVLFRTECCYWAQCFGGDKVKIQNNVSIYEVTVEDGVFCGPSCVFTS